MSPTATAQVSGSPYVEGAVVRVEVDVTVDCDLADPSAISVTVRRPDKSVVKYTYGVDPEVKKVLTPPGVVGEYYIDLDTFDQPGRWTYYWRGTGTNAGAASGSFLVTARPTEDDEP